MSAPPVTAPTMRTPRRAWFALAVLCLPVLLIAVDTTVLAFAVPSLAADLRPSGTELLWTVDVYSLVLATLLVSMGSFGDRVGRRRLLLIGAVGFTVVSALAALSPNPGTLIAARAALGFFGAMLMPSTMSLIRNIFVNDSARRLAIAIWASCFTAGSALGPIVGGALIEHFDWRAVFLLAVPIMVPMLVLAPRLVDESRDPNPGPVDLVSVGLSFATLLPIVWAIKDAAHNGLSPLVAVAVVVGVAAGTAFVRRQQRREIPMLDVGLFGYGPFTASILANFLTIVGLIGFIFFVSQHLQSVLGLSPLVAGLVTLPGAAVSVVAGIVVVWFARRCSAQTLIVTGMLLLAAGFGLVVAMRDNLTVVALILSLVVLEAGVGMAQTMSNDAIVSSVPPSKAGAASAVSETAYEIGAVVGTAGLGSIVTAYYRAGVEVPAGVDPALARDAGESIGGAVAVAEQLPAGLAEALMDSARHAFDSGIGPTAAVAASLAVVAAVVVAALFRRAPSARR